MRIVFLGPDGAGKSTIIGAVERALSDMDLPYSYHYLVPGFLPRYRNVNNGSPVTNPHEKVRHGLLKSLLKLVFWFVEYNLGCGELNRDNKIRLFDRYYYDILVDPARYCYGASDIFTKFVARFIPKPTLLVIVDAPTSTIQDRKQEVSWCETERQRAAYKKLENKYCRTIILDTTKDIESNARKVVSELL
ncbi:hypothetical protein L2750_10055 [Shewanella submarina]|uniref:Thymidylate kinase n=1 Tax=Shewanella submarina TaxID=2016376 RepID=A0ABV7GDL8_9GAMM|nr:hypothetical protein [Shewanella submarina]MCL1037490.1 hypothetical protein [Shewanella submarina]